MTFLMNIILLTMLDAGFLPATVATNQQNPERKEQNKNTTDETLPIQCPNAMTRFEDYCYKFYPQKLSWIEALTFCKLFDMELAKIHSMKQYEFFKYHMKSLDFSDSSHSHQRQQVHYQSNNMYEQQNQNRGVYKADGFWLSATDANSPGNWIWIKDQAQVVFSAWGGKRPDSTIGGCLGLSKKNSFQETVFDCGEALLHPLCEKRKENWPVYMTTSTSNMYNFLMRNMQEEHAGYVRTTKHV